MNKLHWKLLSSEYVFKDKWATLRADTCQMPDGKIISPYYVLEYPNWVNAVVLTDDQQIVLIKQYRHAAGEVILELPGGCIDANETPEDAVKREVLEETGYSCTRIELLAVLYANPSTSKNKTYSFIAYGGKKVQEQQLDGAEEIMVETVSILQLKELLLSNRFGQALHASALFYALQRLEGMH